MRRLGVLLRGRTEKNDGIGGYGECFHLSPSPDNRLISSQIQHSSSSECLSMIFPARRCATTAGRSHELRCCAGRSKRRFRELLATLNLVDFHFVRCAKAVHRPTAGNPNDDNSKRLSMSSRRHPFIEALKSGSPACSLICRPRVSIRSLSSCRRRRAQALAFVTLKSEAGFRFAVPLVGRVLCAEAIAFGPAVAVS